MPFLDTRHLKKADHIKYDCGHYVFKTIILVSNLIVLI